MHDMELTALARKTLKARAHPLHPVVLIGDKGLTDPVLREIEVHLKSHELIKIRVSSADRDEREGMLGTICDRTGAQPVQHIGKVLVIYREKPAEPPPARRKAPTSRKPVRSTVMPPPSARRARSTLRRDQPIVAASFLRDGARRQPASSTPRPQRDDDRETAPTRRTTKAGRAAARPQRRPSSARATAARPARRPTRTR